MGAYELIEQSLSAKVKAKLFYDVVERSIEYGDHLNIRENLLASAALGNEMAQIKIVIYGQNCRYGFTPDEVERLAKVWDRTLGETTKLSGTSSSTTNPDASVIESDDPDDNASERENTESMKSSTKNDVVSLSDSQQHQMFESIDTASSSISDDNDASLSNRPSAN